MNQSGLRQLMRGKTVEELMALKSRIDKKIDYIIKVEWRQIHKEIMATLKKGDIINKNVDLNKNPFKNIIVKEKWKDAFIMGKDLEGGHDITLHFSCVETIHRKDELIWKRKFKKNVITGGLYGKYQN